MPKIYHEDKPEIVKPLLKNVSNCIVGGGDVDGGVGGWGGWGGWGGGD